MDSCKEDRPCGEVVLVPYHMDLGYNDFYNSPLGLMEEGNHRLDRYDHICLVADILCRSTALIHMRAGICVRIRQRMMVTMSNQVTAHHPAMAQRGLRWLSYHLMVEMVAALDYPSLS
jgi:hypothetical protein